MFAVFMILGPVLGTFVYQQWGITVGIGTMGISFLLSAGVLFFLPEDRLPERDQAATSLRQEMIDGIRYVLSKRALTLLGLCFLVAGLAIGLIQPLGIFLVTERLELPKEQLQWLMAASGLGMILGGGIAVGFAKTIAPQKLLMLGMFVSALGMAVCGWSTLLWLTLLVQFISGLVLPMIQIGINTMILQNSAESFVGRVNGILSPLYTGAMVLTMSVAGSLKNMFSIVMMYEMAAILFIVGTLAILPLYRLPAHQSIEESSSS